MIIITQDNLYIGLVYKDTEIGTGFLILFRLLKLFCTQHTIAVEMSI